MANLMTTTTHLFVDGTFDFVPRPFVQLLVVLALDQLTGRTFPVAYGLLRNKSKKLYTYFFTVLKECGPFRARFVASDFEVGLMNSIRVVLSGLEHIPCYFHFVKALGDRAKRVFGKGDAVGKEVVNRLKEATLTPLDQLTNFRRCVECELLEEHPTYEKKMRSFFRYFDETCVLIVLSQLTLFSDGCLPACTHQKSGTSSSI